MHTTMIIKWCSTNNFEGRDHHNFNLKYTWYSFMTLFKSITMFSETDNIPNLGQLTNYIKF